MRILVTGGCGFIGSNFVRFLLDHYQPLLVTNVDALTYAGNIENIAGSTDAFGERYEFFLVDIADVAAMREIFSKQKYYAVVNFAAESHVDRSIQRSLNFGHSNVTGVNVLLELCREFHVKRFLQISTDEVYGDHAGDTPFTETSPLNPSSPYSASKASADMLALAAAKTYGQEIIITRCTNNYGSFQHPEKFIPRAITQALSDESIPVYGDGKQRRDWLHVHDHCRALQVILLEGRAGEIYNISAGHECSNLDLAKQILSKLGKPESLLRHVSDRLGHDKRYFIDSSKLRRELDWKPNYDFETGLEETLQWYQANHDWWEPKLQDSRQTLPA
ncbi:MAG: dTDP-glucose 4,6-dehydratase [Chthoniobacterales bacterium]